MFAFINFILDFKLFFPVRWIRSWIWLWYILDHLFNTFEALLKNWRWIWWSVAEWVRWKCWMFSRRDFLVTWLLLFYFNFLELSRCKILIDLFLLLWCWYLFLRFLFFLWDFLNCIGFFEFTLRASKSIFTNFRCKWRSQVFFWWAQTFTFRYLTFHWLQKQRSPNICHLA